MLALDIWLPFLAASLLLSLAPGPDNLIVISLGLSRGRAAAISFAIGCSLGCLTHTFWVAIGVAALLETSVVALSALKGFGAAYLLFLAFGLLRSKAAKPVGRLGMQLDAIDAESNLRYLINGFVANSINPKVALFFLALLPQFVDQAAADAKLQVAQLGLLFAAQAVVLFMALGFFAGSLSVRLKRSPSIGRNLDNLAAAVFVLVAVTLLIS